MTSTPQDPIRDPDYWHERAAETRAKADSSYDPKTVLRLLKVAEEYDRMAERAERWQTADQLKDMGLASSLREPP
jgi:hypothetical protein